MRVLQFAFDGDPANPHLPYLHERASVVYTGTHDNDTTLRLVLAPRHGNARARVQLYLGAAAGAVPEALIRAALGSVARLAIVPVQDLLGLGSAARLNTPGTAERQLELAAAARRAHPRSRAPLRASSTQSYGRS